MTNSWRTSQRVTFQTVPLATVYDFGSETIPAMSVSQANCSIECIAAGSTWKRTACGAQALSRVF